MNAIRLTPAVKSLMIACFVAFVLQQTGDRFFGTHFFELFALTPKLAVEHFYFWQLITFSFLHADVMHLFFNLLMLAFIGSELESTWGRARFLRFYFLCTAFAGLTYLVLQLAIDKTAIPMVGASGGIYGLLMAYGLIYGERVLLFMMLFPMKAKHFIWVLAGIEFMSSIFSNQNPWGSVAHLGGMAGGFGLLWGRAAWTVYHRRLNETREIKQKDKRRKGAKHLKLVVNRKDSSQAKGSEQDSDDSPKTWH